MADHNTREHPIDAVILWVDGNDAKHQTRMLPFLENKAIAHSKNFRTRFDQVNEIKYTVDSLLKFAPFIRNIFIVTDQQIPAFIEDKKNIATYKKVSIIDHLEIFTGYEEFLPTFNNRPLETCIYRIPHLAEHFIYLNDDFFLINDTKPSDYFVDGKPVLRGKWRKIDKEKLNKRSKAGHKMAQQKAAQIAGFNKYYNFRHTPHPLRKSTFKDFFERNKDTFLENIKYRFRSENQFTPQGLANHLEIKNKTCILQSDLQLLYFRSYKKPLFWYKYKLNTKSKNKLFLGLQSLDLCPPHILKYILKWLDKRMY